MAHDADIITPGFQRCVQEPCVIVTTGEPHELWEVPTSVNTRYLSHDYFRYIGKFPPQIARKLILEYSQPGDVVLDPMCGGGTTLIEARLTGRESIGIDVNPISVLISEVTTRALDDSQEEQVQEFIRRLMSVVSPQTTLPLIPTYPEAPPKMKPLPNMHGHEKYFDDEALNQLRIFFCLLDDIDADESREFVLLALLSILRSVSHANVKKMNLELDLNKRSRRPLVSGLSAKIAKMLATNAELRACFKGGQSRVIRSSAAKTELSDGSAGLIVLHPPYLTNTAFSEATQLQLAVLGISHRTIWKRELRARGSFLHEPNGLKKYVVGWNHILAEAHRVLREGGYCAVVIGDGQMDYTRIPMGAISIELAKDHGFDLVRRAEHKLNNHTGQTQSRKMRGQHILIFRKSK